jgi:endonuclease/exonuclease/phosphatase family metal-dependent hydrolase
VVSGLNVRDADTREIIAFLPKGQSAQYIGSTAGYYIVELSDGSQGEVSKSWAVKVEGSTSSTLRVATFNIQIFGKTKANKPEIMVELAAIIRKYDVVAVQEIKDKDGVVPQKFLQAINANGVEYAFVISERGGQQVDDQGSQEQYAYFYNTKTVKVLDAGGLFNDSAADHFQREPYIARFGSIKGALTFVLITIHTKPEEAVNEIKALHHVVELAQQAYAGEDDFMVLGDFNAGCDYTAPEDFNGHPIAEDYKWCIFWPIMNTHSGTS